MRYDPPNGIVDFVRVLQRCDARDAESLLALAFDNCAADAVTQDLRLRFAAPQLLAACKAALNCAETGRALDWQTLYDAVARVEGAPDAPEAIRA